jgi:uncharacterized protein (TIGR02246 family)
MTKTFLTTCAVGLGAVALALPVGASAQQTMRCTKITELQAEKLFTEFDAAWATRDPKKVTALFGKDAVLLATVSNKPRVTRDEIEDYFVGFLANGPRGSIKTSTYDIGCNMVSRVGTWDVALTYPDGKTTTVNARYTFIYKYENGRWAIDHLHSSMMPEKTS